ncbi:MAG: hypothetical protein ACR2QW_02545 [bacterium]
MAVNIAAANPLVRRRKILFTYTGLLVLLTPYLVIQIQQLLAFFGSGISAIVQMLGHGYGASLLQSNFAILLLGIILVSLLGYRYRHLILRYWILVSLIFFPLAGGLFGISTASLILPPLVVTISVAALEFRAWVEGRNMKIIP